MFEDFAGISIEGKSFTQKKLIYLFFAKNLKIKKVNPQSTDIQLSMVVTVVAKLPLQML